LVKTNDNNSNYSRQNDKLHSLQYQENYSYTCVKMITYKKIYKSLINNINRYNKNKFIDFCISKSVIVLLSAIIQMMKVMTGHNFEYNAPVYLLQKEIDLCA